LVGQGSTGSRLLYRSKWAQINQGVWSWLNKGLSQGADVDASGYLYTIATVGMTFAGLSVLTMILGKCSGVK